MYEDEFLELSLEELEGIQGGGWFKKVKKIVKNILKPVKNEGISKPPTPIIIKF